PAHERSRARGRGELEMDEQKRRAEQLLEERMKSRQPKPNGAQATEPTDVGPSTDDGAQIAEDYKADLQRMAADFSNYRKRNEAERTEFAKFAKADLITKLLDVLDGYDRAAARVADEVKGQPWGEGMWLVERKLRQILDAEGLEPVDSLG